jgi:hypothetical protein
VASSSLVLHRGAVQVTPDELESYQAPPPSGRWFPLSHSRVLSVVSRNLIDLGYRVERQELGLMRDGSRFFATLDLASPVADGVSLAVGIRNSVDKSFPLGFCAGSRVFVCDNLAFRSELLVRRKHTIHGERDFARRIAEAVAGLDTFRADETGRIDRLRALEVAEERADALILRGYEAGIVGPRELPRVLREWRNPPHEDFRPRTAWSLLNAFTAALKAQARLQPHAFAVRTMRLGALLDPERN